MRGLSATILGLVLLLAAPASRAQQTLIQCIVSAENPLLRAEGKAERVGDILLNCVGGDPDTVRFINLSILFNGNLTSNLTGDDPDDTEALLLLDEPRATFENVANRVKYQGQVIGTPGIAPGAPGGPGAQGSGNVYRGRRQPGTRNRLDFSGIPYVPEPHGGTRVLRIVNIRLDMTTYQTDQENPPPVTATLFSNPPALLFLNFPSVVVGAPTKSFETDAEEAFGRFQMHIRETFPSAFRKRIANTTLDATSVRLQAMTAQRPVTESGFTPEQTGAAPQAPGVADTGTRVVAWFGDIPPGAFLSAPARATSVDEQNNPGQLEFRRVLDYQPDYSGGILAGAGDPDELVPIAGGRATLVYEVVAAAPYQNMSGADLIEAFTLPVEFSYPQPVNLEAAYVALGLGPIDETGEPSGPAPEPRFYTDLDPAMIHEVKGGVWVNYVALDYVPTDELPVTRLVDVADAVEGRAVSATVATVTQSGGAWLAAAAVTPGAETDKVEIAVTPAALPAGVYYGAVTLRRENNPKRLVVVPVILNVSPPPELTVDTAPMRFLAELGAPPPEPQRRLVNARNKWLEYEATVTTATGGNWLFVNPVTEKTPETIAVTVDATGLSPGTYEGTVSIGAELAVNSPRVIPVTLVVAAAIPAFEPGGIVSAASFENGFVSPGELVTFFGQRVGPDQPAGLQIGPDGKVATLVAGTQFLFDGVPAPIVALSRYQSTCVVPYSVANKRSTMVAIDIDGVRTPEVQVQATPVKPGVFTADASGAGQAATVNQDDTLNSPANPAAPGSVITLYLTGVGQTDPAGIDGKLNAVPYPRPAAPITVKIGGVPSAVEFFGGAPGMVAGAIQLNVRAPATPGPAVPLQISVGGRDIQNGVTLAIE